MSCYVISNQFLNRSVPGGRSHVRIKKLWKRMLLVLLGSFALSAMACSKAAPPPAKEKVARSAITVTVAGGSPVLLKSTSAEFDIGPSGYVQAFFLQDGNRLTLDEPDAGLPVSGDSLLSAGKEIGEFHFDLDRAKFSDAQGKLGTLGKRVEITGRSSSGAAGDIEEVLVAELYDSFPTLALTTATYRNVGSKDIRLDQVVTQRHRLNAALIDPTGAPHDLWSFQGSSYDWGKEEILRIPKSFSQPNLMGGPGPKGQGGGIPVVDFWTSRVGEAVGHLESLPRVLSLPVQVAKDGRIHVSMALEPGITLKPGEAYSTPTSFVMVHSGDYYESLHLWSSALQQCGWKLPKASNADYSANWCGWGYE
ncbi:MAG TPA: hypothetical protein VMW38_06070, partial [Terriglobia bacterium]|nr:hypothetical protein [Terriglobia bacterium]